MSIASFHIDAEWEKLFSILLNSIRELVRPEELDRLLSAYQVQQAKNQYEYILRITAARHEARLFHLQLELESRKQLAASRYALAVSGSAGRLIGQTQNEQIQMMLNFTAVVDQQLRSLVRVQDFELQSTARSYLERSFRHSLSAMEEASTVGIQRVISLLH